MEAASSPRRKVEKGCGFWPAGGTEPVKVKRTFHTRNATRTSHENIVTPVQLDGQRQEGSPTAPFGTDVDHASDTAGNGERLKLLVDGGARCVEVRAKSSAGSSAHDPPITQRNVLTGQGDIDTHAASAHMSAAQSGGMTTSDLSLGKAAPGAGAKKHLHTPRNVITGEGICGHTDIHMASAHVAGLGSDSDEATRGGLRRRAPGSIPGTSTDPMGGDSPTRNILLGHGVTTHHQSAHLVASASGSARVYRQTPKTRRDPMRSSANDLLHFDENAQPAPSASAQAESATSVKPMSYRATTKRSSSSQMFGGERPF